MAKYSNAASRMQDTLRVGKMVGLRVRKRRCQNTTDSAARYRLTPDVAACPKTFTNSEVATFHSITSSARASSVGGTEMPSAFAVFKLITSSNLVGCSTGRSAGFAPLKILSTKAADRR